MKCWWHWVALTSQFEAWSRIWAQGYSWRRKCCLLDRHQYSSICVQCANSRQKYVCILLHKALSDVNDSSITGLVLVKILFAIAFPHFIACSCSALGFALAPHFRTNLLHFNKYRGSSDCCSLLNTDIDELRISDKDKPFIFLQDQGILQP